MNGGQLLKEVVVLTADKNARFALQGILRRYQSLGIRQITPDYYQHPGKDPGVLHSAHDFLQPFTQVYAHAVVLMDREGCGQDKTSRIDLEGIIEQRLQRSGWGDRAAAVVIDPELDAWVWSDSQHVDHALGWSQHQPDLRSWLRSKSMLAAGAVKPRRPKEALEMALREARKPRSSSIYEDIASKVSLTRCNDLAFCKLRDLLQGWFPAG
jgi:hypothetical protein